MRKLKTMKLKKIFDEYLEYLHSLSNEEFDKIIEEAEEHSK
jgi:hypothetical protein